MESPIQYFLPWSFRVRAAVAVISSTVWTVQMYSPAWDAEMGLSQNFCSFALEERRDGLDGGIPFN